MKKNNQLLEEECKKIIGGGTITGSFLSAFKGIGTLIFEVGQAVGGAIRRITSNKLCSF